MITFLGIIEHVLAFIGAVTLALWIHEVIQDRRRLRRNRRL